MNIGYACITLGVPYTQQKTCRMRNADQKTLVSLIANNLNALHNIIHYNIEKNIKIFRVSSDLIPFGSNALNQIKWWDLFDAQFNQIAQTIQTNNLRISTHPGQYSVLNSPNQDVVKRSIEDLRYHCKIMDSLKCDHSCKLILHVGGVYGDKKTAIKRFITAFKTLDLEIAKRIVLENDDKYFNIEDVLCISDVLNVPVILDVLHHKINPAYSVKNINNWLALCNQTFTKADGKQKIHYSEQNIYGRAGAHSATISSHSFLDFYNSLENKNIDIMLEVKDKNLSAIKCMNTINPNNGLSALEKEWQRYEYRILELCPEIHHNITSLIQSTKNSYPVVEFYNYLDLALQTPAKKDNSLIVIKKILRDLSEYLSEKQKIILHNKLNLYKKGVISIKPLKALLFEYALSLNLNTLAYSYFFHL